MILCTFQAEPTQYPQVSLVHTFALNLGVMWEPASHRSGWFGRLRPLTRGGGPPSLTFESVDARHLLPGRRVKQMSR